MVLPLNGHCKQPRESDPSSGTVIPIATFHALRWQTFLRRYFSPLPPLKRVRRELCVKDFDRRMHRNPQGRSGRVTFHERLEAHQNLREWLEINAPTMVEALLAPGRTPRELQHLLRDYKR
jgi:hypothetical protein